MSEAEYDFVEAFLDLLHDLRRLQQRLFVIEPGSYLSQYEELVGTLATLDAPDAEWQQVQTDMVREIQRRLTMMKLMVGASSEEQVLNQARWREAEDRFRRLLKSKARFWRGWPHVFPGAAV